MTAQPDSPLLAWSPLTDADLSRWHRLVTAIAEADGTQEWLTEQDLADDLAAPWRDRLRDTTIGVDETGAARAYAVVDLRPGDRTLLRAWCGGGVDPGWRRLGIGRRLLGWQLRRCAEVVAARRAELGEPVPARAVVEVDERWASAARLAERAGLHPIRSSVTMRRDLSAPVPAVPVPRGLRLTGYDPELDERVRLAHNEAFTDHWGFQPWTAQAWSHWESGHRDFRPDCSFVVLDGDQVAGYALSATYPGDWEPAGFTQGWTGKLGVRRPWRGRGVAKVLLTASMRAFQASGLEYAGLDVDTDNLSGAVALYSGLGYEVRHRSTLWATDLPPVNRGAGAGWGVRRWRGRGG